MGIVTPDEGRGPVLNRKLLVWIPAFTGMTESGVGLGRLEDFVDF